MAAPTISEELATAESLISVTPVLRDPVSTLEIIIPVAKEYKQKSPCKEFLIMFLLVALCLVATALAAPASIPEPPMIAEESHIIVSPYISYPDPTLFLRTLNMRIEPEPKEEYNEPEPMEEFSEPIEEPKEELSEPIEEPTEEIPEPIEEPKEELPEPIEEPKEELTEEPKEPLPTLPAAPEFKPETKPEPVLINLAIPKPPSSFPTSSTPSLA
ncbi:diacylglycerol kinase kappa-like [Leguminivora glycinivorella]|uniref:diacylglycerol kinase kappa-like n=1 Tax=Leguminivora glycinivorella TaxID=1035111 RepID=UPI00200F2DC5|nr:diacylglycerol kinase kappa-like [Leguminivora glycinivorella]